MADFAGARKLRARMNGALWQKRVRRRTAAAWTWWSSVWFSSFPSLLCRRSDSSPCVGAPTAETGAWTAVGASVPRTHVPPWVCAQRVSAQPPPALRDVAELATHAHAQDGEDVYAAAHFFYGRTGGMILVTGALDGIRFSTSYLFETDFGHDPRDGRA